MAHVSASTGAGELFRVFGIGDGKLDGFLEDGRGLSHPVGWLGDWRQFDLGPFWASVILPSEPPNCPMQVRRAAGDDIVRRDYSCPLCCKTHLASAGLALARGPDRGGTVAE